MLADFHCLDDCYLSTRRLSGVKKPTSSEPAESPEAAKDVQMTAPIKWSSPPEGLELFAKSLTKFTQYTELRRLSTISSVSDMLNEPGLVSTIEFDRDNEYFAISGADMRIKMFEYSNVIRNDVTTHYPITEIPCRAKVSSVSWSNYHKGMLASSDYEGSVTLWDAYRAQRIRTFQEHERRCWSVHFNNVDTNMLASGSDDTSVKLWAPNTPHSVTSIPSKFSVCSVRFNPESRFHLAVGSADHCVHYYDLRSCKTALNVFMGHRKSVSYVKFLNAGELVSASADSQLKLWKTDDPRCLRTFKGHINERMFVGLSTGGDYIACGSENNSLYVYYKGLSTEVQTWSFSTLYGGARTYANNVGLPGEVQDFVSSVCWMPGTDVVMAANSRGTIQLLKLV